MHTDLTGKVALVTGGGSGIGETTCRMLARAGAAVAVVDYRVKAARWGIRVNTIIPGSLSTNIDERTYHRNCETVTWDVRMPEHFPPRGARRAAPEEVAGLVLYPVSDASHYVTGTEVTIDAGFTLPKG